MDYITSYRSQRGKILDEKHRFCDIYESVHFGSPAYILEDELNEMQWIQISQRAKLLRSEMTSGFLKIPDITYDVNNRTLTNSDDECIFLIGGYPVTINNFTLDDIDVEDTVYVKLIFKSQEINSDDRLGKATTKRVVQDISFIVNELPDECSNEHEKDNYYFVFNNSNEYNDSDEYYISKLCTITNNDTPNIYLAKKYQIPLDGSITYTDNTLTSSKNASINFSECDSVLYSKKYGTEGNTKVKAWHSNSQDAKTYNNSTELYDIDINAGVLSDGVWNQNIKKYVQIGDTTNPPVGTIVTWGPDNTIPSAVVDTTKRLYPGSKINVTGDMSSAVTKNYTGDTDYVINISLNTQTKLKSTKIGSELDQPAQQKDFYNKFTVNQKGVITSANVATSLSELGITEFDIDDKEDWSLIHYNINDNKWLSKSGIISNLDKNFVYASDDGVINGSKNGATFSPSSNRILNYDGILKATSFQSTTGADLAEKFKVKDSEEFVPGDIISINNDGEYIKSNKEDDANVIGVYSDTYGYCLNYSSEGKSIPIGLCGRVKAKITGDVKIGDLITTSDIAGVGKKSTNNINGTIIGKALENHTGKNIDRIEILIVNG